MAEESKDDDFVYRPCPEPYDEDGDLSVRYLEWVKEQIQYLFLEALHGKRLVAWQNDPDNAACQAHWDALYNDLVQNVCTFMEMEEAENQDSPPDDDYWSGDEENEASYERLVAAYRQKFG